MLLVPLCVVFLAFEPGLLARPSVCEERVMLACPASQFTFKVTNASSASAACL